MATDWRVEQKLLSDTGIVIGPGLSETELQDAESELGTRFPPDLRDFLTVGLPLGERFPNWRQPNSTTIRELLDWPFEGMAFDIRVNNFWLDDWGPRPHDDGDAVTLAGTLVAAAPRLIPIFAHRYLPATPCLPGNPVFSVYQTDIIQYGVDLANYLRAELCPSAMGEPASRESREIAFWSAFVD